MNRQPYGIKNDCWAYGCILFALAAGKPPFDGTTIQETLKLVKGGSLEYPKNFSSCLRDLLSSVIQWDPESRLNMKEILNHPFFDDDKPKETLRKGKKNYSSTLKKVSSCILQELSAGNETTRSSSIHPEISLQKLDIMLKKKDENKKVKLNQSLITKLAKRRNESNNYDSHPNSNISILSNRRSKTGISNSRRQNSELNEEEPENPLRYTRSKTPNFFKSSKNFRYQFENPKDCPQNEILEKEYFCLNFFKSDQKPKPSTKALSTSLQDELFARTVHSTRNLNSSKNRGKTLVTAQKLSLIPSDFPSNNPKLIPLSTKGILPNSYRIKDAVIRITNQNLEMEKENGKYIFRISENGKRIAILKRFDEENCKEYSLPTLPPKYRSFYEYASKVCNILRQRNIVISDKLGKFIFCLESNLFQAELKSGFSVSHEISNDFIVIRIQNGSFAYIRRSRQGYYLALHNMQTYSSNKIY